MNGNNDVEASFLGFLGGGFCRAPRVVLANPGSYAALRPVRTLASDRASSDLANRAPKDPTGDLSRVPLAQQHLHEELAVGTGLRRPGAVPAWSAALLALTLALSAPTHATNTSAQVIGATPVQVDANFVAVIQHNLASTSGAARLANLSNAELQDLAYAVTRRSGGNPWPVYSTIAAYSSAQAARFSAAASLAVAAYTGTNAVAKYAMYIKAGPVPNLDMTIQEIYLEFRTAPVGALSVEASVASTITYAAGNLAGAYGAGTLIGSGIHWLIETYAPEWDNKIGATLDGIINTMISVASYARAEGQQELDLLTVLGLFTYEFSNGLDLGDWGVLDDIFDAGSLCINPLDC